MQKWEMVLLLVSNNLSFVGRESLTHWLYGLLPHKGVVLEMVQVWRHQCERAMSKTSINSDSKNAVVITDSEAITRETNQMNGVWKKGKVCQSAFKFLQKHSWNVIVFIS